MSRWAVLWDVFAGQPKPVGIAVGHTGHVHVYVPPSFGVPSRFSGEYRVLQPDGSLVTYTPGSESYFDQVLVDLSRRFSIGKVGVEPALDTDKAMDIYLREVAAPMMHPHGARHRLAGSSHHDGPHEQLHDYQPRRRAVPEALRRGLMSAA